MENQNSNKVENIGTENNVKKVKKYRGNFRVTKKELKSDWDYDMLRTELEKEEYFAEGGII